MHGHCEAHAAHFRALLGLVTALGGCTSHRIQTDLSRDLQLEALTFLKITVTTDADPQLRAEAVGALESVSGPESTTWIQQALFDPDAEVRLRACLILGRRDPGRFVTAFSRLLMDSDPAVRTAAMIGCYEAGRIEYRQPAIEAVRASPEPFDSQAEELLLSRVAEWLDDSELRLWMHSGEKSFATRRRCATAELLRRGDTEVNRRLILTAQSAPPEAQREAIQLLAWSLDPKVLYILQDRLVNCPDVEGQLAAARSLTEFGSAAGLKTALRGLAYPATFDGELPAPDSQRAVAVRLLACDACARIRDERCLEPLAQLLSAEEARLRLGAAAAILRMNLSPGVSNR